MAPPKFGRGIRAGRAALLTDAERQTVLSACPDHPAARNLAVGLAHGDDVIPASTVGCADDREEVELVRGVLVDGLLRNIGFEPTLPKAIGSRPTDSFSVTHHGEYDMAAARGGANNDAATSRTKAAR